MKPDENATENSDDRPARKEHFDTKRPVFADRPFVCRAKSALHVKQFDVEDQRRIRRDDAAGAARAIAKGGRNDQGALAADLHRGDAFVPAGNHLALSDRKFERLVAIDRAVELLALLAIFI